MSKQKNIFISHYEKDDVHVQSLKKRLIRDGYDVKNFSVDSTKHKDGRRPSDAVIKRLLDIRIKASSTFICLIGPDTHTRKWVNYEIRKAHLEGKKIIGIYSHGNKDNVELPEAFKKYGSSTLGWNSIEKLGEIISGGNIPFENPDGSKSNDLHKSKRIKC
ncbi:TIR domain-containing protein [Flavobacterium chungangensis]|uniref:TIR domain-containing protein n=1 Tax=Flavobacterium chungangensis TaxID=2708132 RepID=A0ABV8ZB69_9FLAO